MHIIMIKPETPFVQNLEKKEMGILEKKHPSNKQEQYRQIK